MTTRRRFLAAGALALLAPAAALGQGSVKRPVVAYVFGSVATSEMSGPEPAHAHVRAFVSRLRELGWEDGRNLVLEYHGAENRRERAQAILAELSARNVDVIYAAATAGGAQVATDAILATRTIPIVFASGSDVVAAGLVSSLAKPGGNATGVTIAVGPEILGKRLQLLKEIAPRIKRVAYIDPKSSNIDFLRQFAARIGLAPIVVEVERAEDYDAAFAMVKRERADALLIGSYAVNMVHAPRIVEFAAQQRLPASFAFSESVEAGGLVSYSIDFLDLHRRGAAYVDKILRGAKPGDLPVELPSKFELVVNMKTARALGIAIPQAVLLRTDRVIE